MRLKMVKWGFPAPGNGRFDRPRQCRRREDQTKRLKLIEKDEKSL